MDQLKSLINIWIHLKFQTMEFEVLYPEDTEIDKLRDKTLPDFFWNINDLYWDYFLITIAKLLDKHKQGQNINLTLYVLPSLLEKNNIKNHPTIDEKINTLSDKFKTVTYYRRKHLAHFDFDYTTGVKNFNSTTKIEDVKYFLDVMLELIRETQSLLSLEKFSGIVMYPGRYLGAKELLRILVEKDNYKTGNKTNKNS